MGRHALLVGASTFADPALENLPGVRHDIDQLKAVLDQCGQFDSVEPVLDPSRDRLAAAIEEFYGMRRYGDLALLYYSGHGMLADDNESLFLAAVDSSRDGALHAGAIDADGVLRHCLNSTKANQKVVLLDCCFSGAFELRNRFRGGVRQEPRRGIRQNGTFVLTASTHVKAAKSQGPDRPSVFTSIVLDGLRGEAKSDRDGWITTNDLALHVHRASTLGRPVESSEGVTEPIQLVLAEVREPTTDQPRTSRHIADDAELDTDQWRRLLDYYVTCLERGAVLGSFVPISNRDSYVVGAAGPESVFSAAPESRPEQPSFTQFAKRCAANGAAMRYGYPLLVLPGQPKRSDLRFAPLLVSDIATSADDRLFATPPVVNRAVTAELGLSEVEVDDLCQQFEETFAGGDPGSLDRAVRRLLDILGLHAAGELQASSLLGVLPNGPANRVHNVAVLHTVDPSAGAQRQLLEELRKAECGRFAQTALGVLSDSAVTLTAVEQVPIVSPVRLNEAQEAIVRSAMSEALTVAQGPPGTGKSQLVTALVATATAAGQRVLVGSTNNRAVDEVCSRIASAVGPGLLIRTGNREHTAREPAQLVDLLSRYAGKPPADVQTPAADLRIAEAEIGNLRAELDERRRCERDLAELAEERAGYEPIELPDDELVKLVGWSDRAVRRGLLGWWWRRRLRAMEVVGRAAIVDFGLRMTVELRWRAARKQLAGMTAPSEIWSRLSTLVTDERPNASRQLLEAQIANRVGAGRDRLEARIEIMSRTPQRTWTRFAELLNVLPAWATTTMSVRSLKGDPGLFDLVIIDEAAQCTIPAVLPMLFRAKRVLIIGDPRQLSPVIVLPDSEDEKLQKRAGLSESWLEQRRLEFTRHSAYDAFAAVAKQTHLLDEHYRCHPQIVARPNRWVYQNRLTVLTDRAGLRAPRDEAVAWKHVSGAFSHGRSGSGMSRPEIDAVVNEVSELRAQYPGASIGVVTPLAAQARAIDRALTGVGIDEREVVRGTIHRFQGGERDIMVVSPVGAEGIQRRTQNWLVGQTNLWNVAITRARSQLIVVGDRDWWSAQRGLLQTLLHEDTESASTDRPVKAIDNLQAAVRRAGRTVARDVRAGGHRYDLVVDDAVILQVDDPVGDADGRELRKLLAWLDIGSTGLPIRRVPVWRCYHEPDSVVAELLD
ncbi:caspase, EACC1-associated type [Kribbella sp. CA-247076]|uniref:caspase, EACC1-associated type n=1 Tax=Kribbella sp. CA-247076 TaxID=3239941 RepID=UPI003D93F37E